MQLRRRQPTSPLLGAMRHSVLRKSPRTRRRRQRQVWRTVAGVIAAIGIAAYWYFVFWVGDSPVQRREVPALPAASEAPASPVRPALPPVEAISAAQIVQEGIARTAQGLARRGMTWDTSYAVIAYPGGDVAVGGGTGADLLVRALRGVNVDLQVLIHEDRLAHPERYPLHRWRDAPADTNIDHRRVVNQWAFFNHFGERLDASTSPEALASFQPGDIVFWGEARMDVPTNVGIVSKEREASGMPRVIAIRREEGVLSDRVPLNHRPLMAHFRLNVSRLP